VAASGSRKLIIEILGNARDAAKAFGDVRSDSAKTEERLDRFGTSALGVGVAVAAGLAYAVTQFVEADVASQKLDNSARNAAASAKINAAALRDVAQATQSKTAADGDALVAGQAMLVQFGATQDETVALTPLLADLSRKMGVDTETAARAVGKALNGSTGQLSKMGIQVDQTRAQTDPFNATMEALTSTVGGFAESEGATAAGTLERIKNQLGDIVEAVGGGALDVFGPVIEAIGSISANGGPAGAALGDIAGKLGGITAVGALAAGGMIKARDGINAVRDASFGAAGNLGKMGYALGALGVVTAVAALVAIVQSINEATKSAEDFDAAMIKFRGTGNATAQINAFADAVDAMTGTGDDVFDFLARNLGGGMQTLEVNVKGAALQLDGIGRAFDQLKAKGDTTSIARTIELLEQNAQGSEAAMAELNEVLGPYKQSVINAADATGNFADKTDEQKIASLGAAEAIDEHVAAVKASMDPFFAAIRSADQSATARRKAADAQNILTIMEMEGKQGTAEYAAVQRDLRQAHIDSGSAAMNHQGTLQTLAARLAEGTTSVDVMRTRLNEWVRSGLISRDTAATLAAQFGLTAGSARGMAGDIGTAKTKADNLNGTRADVSVWANTADALWKLGELKRRMDELVSAGRNWAALGLLAGSGTIRTRATGGPTQAGQPYLVGERGPEIVVPGSGYVVPTRRLIDAPTGGGGGGSNLVINVSAGVGDPVSIGRTVVETIKAYERTSGTAWRN
jgi:hypothetical protein